MSLGWDLFNQIVDCLLSTYITVHVNCLDGRIIRFDHVRIWWNKPHFVGLGVSLCNRSATGLLPEGSHQECIWVSKPMVCKPFYLVPWGLHFDEYLIISALLAHFFGCKSLVLLFRFSVSGAVLVVYVDRFKLFLTENSNPGRPSCDGVLGCVQTDIYARWLDILDFTSPVATHDFLMEWLLPLHLKLLQFLPLRTERESLRVKHNTWHPLRLHRCRLLLSMLVKQRAHRRLCFFSVL